MDNVSVRRFLIKHLAELAVAHEVHRSLADELEGKILEVSKTLIKSYENGGYNGKEGKKKDG